MAKTDKRKANEGKGDKAARGPKHSLDKARPNADGKNMRSAATVRRSRGSS